MAENGGPDAAARPNRSPCSERPNFFPEYQALPLVGLVASLAVEDSVLRYAERQGLIVLAIGDQLMEVQNTPGFIPRRY